MPEGRVVRFNSTTGTGRIETKTGHFQVRAEDMEPQARVEGAFVEFDVQRDEPFDRAVNVRLREGTRVNKRQRRFGRQHD